jgi:hypothetical protein
MQLSPELEPGHRPPATLPPPPSRRKGRDELKSAAAFRITVSRTQLRYPGTAPIDDLDPDDAGPVMTATVTVSPGAPVPPCRTLLP